MPAACFMVCGREKYSGHSPPLLCLPANGAQEPHKLEGLPILSLSETSHGTVDSDAATGSYRKADGLPEICFPSLTSLNSVLILIFNQQSYRTVLAI